MLRMDQDSALGCTLWGYCSPWVSCFFMSSSKGINSSLRIISLRMFVYLTALVEIVSPSGGEGRLSLLYVTIKTMLPSEAKLGKFACRPL